MTDRDIQSYVVRGSANTVVGFCATYLSYCDTTGEKLVGSIAILLVRSGFRGQGVGLSLYNDAVAPLKRIRGLIRLRLGSTFPRIFFGPPVAVGFIDEVWLEHRGWFKNVSTRGQISFDLLLDLDKIGRIQTTASPGDGAYTFRRCTVKDVDLILTAVEQGVKDGDYMGWLDQYSQLSNNYNIQNVIVGYDGDAVIAVALTYIPHRGDPIAADLPWVARIGSDVGGITCPYSTRRYLKRDITALG